MHAFMPAPRLWQLTASPWALCEFWLALLACLWGVQEHPNMAHQHADMLKPASLLPVFIDGIPAIT